VAEADPVALYEQATVRAIEVAAAVGPNQLDDPTPCAAWTVQDLLDHLVAGTDYLHSAIEGEMPPDPRRGTTAVDLRAGVGTCLAGLDEPDNLTRTCVSPLGFEWTVAEAAAGTFMDVLVHTWDLATATGQDPALDADLVDACIALFLPDMPERGRAAGIVGPAVPVPEDAPPQDRLLAAMGRTP
jgi:uncharacterized protein (TIGR03086 family)